MSASGSAPAVDVRRAGERFVITTGWLHSAHSFSFGFHFDPDNTSHGSLVVHNEDVVIPGGGFDTHRHADMEIVTWVLEGALVHEDSTGQRGVLTPGVAQCLSAGSGVQHSERNHSTDAGGDPVHFVQMWVVPDAPGAAPSYQQRAVADQLAGSGLVPVVSGLTQHADAAVSLGNASAAFLVGRLEADTAVALPEAPYLHMFVARGAVMLEGAGTLDTGDAARLSSSGGQRVTATAPAELLVWEMHAALGA
jgi:hypothetical protein